MRGYILAYFAGLLVLSLELVRALHPAARGFPPLAPPGDMLRLLLVWNSGVLIWRLAIRAACTAVVYGLGEATLSVPRALVGNCINIAAALRALRLYIGLSLGLTRPRWDKTVHRFPAAAD